jgi:hypothetical protein
MKAIQNMFYIFDKQIFLWFNYKATSMMGMIFLYILTAKQNRGDIIKNKIDIDWVKITLD